MFKEPFFINVVGIMEDKSGNIWFTNSDNGIFRYDGKTAENFNTKELLGKTTQEIWGIIIEESGIIWVTAHGTATRYAPTTSLANPKAFTVFRPTEGQA